MGQLCTHRRPAATPAVTPEQQLPAGAGDLSLTKVERWRQRLQYATDKGVEDAQCVFLGYPVSKAHHKFTQDLSNRWVGVVAPSTCQGTYTSLVSFRKEHQGNTPGLVYQRWPSKREAASYTAAFANFEQAQAEGDSHQQTTD